MRFSTIVAFMFPLAALAAPAPLVDGTDRVASIDVRTGFDQAMRAVDSALSIATALNIRDVVKTIQDTQEIAILGLLKNQVDNIVGAIGGGTVPPPAT